MAFGVDSALMEDLLSQAGESYTVCNFGLYAAVGTSAMLSLSEKDLNAWDRVVLAIEPTSETFSTYFGATAFWKCAESSPELLLNVNSSQKSALVGNYLTYLQERTEIFRSGILPQPTDSYAKASFDETCNMIYDRAGNAMALGYDTGNPIDLDALTISPDFAEQVNKQIVLSGTSATEANGALWQLQQALSSGVLRGEELNSVMEGTPMISQTIAKYMVKQCSPECL